MSEKTEVEDIVAYELSSAGHEIRRQVVCGSGRCDIFDGTTSAIIECKLVGDSRSLAEAAAQLERYRPYFFDPQLAIAVPRVEREARWLIPALEKRNIMLIEIEKGIGV